MSGTLSLLVLMSIFAVGFAIGHGARHGKPARQAGMSFAMLLLGLGVSALLVVHAAISVSKLLPGLGAWFAPPVSEAYAAASAPTVGASHGVAAVALDPVKPQDMVDALALIVAVVTLTLTLGSTWLAQRLREVDQIVSRVQQTSEQMTRKFAVESQKQAVMSLLPQARNEIGIWLQGKSSQWTTYAYVLGNDLELLACLERQHRRAAFASLSNMLERGADRLPSVRAYAEGCHRLACMRAELEWDDDAPLRSIKLLDLEAQGLWCRIFDRAEIRRCYAKRVPPAAV